MYRDRRQPIIERMSQWQEELKGKEQELHERKENLQHYGFTINPTPSNKWGKNSAYNHFQGWQRRLQIEEQEIQKLEQQAKNYDEFSSSNKKGCSC